LNSMWSATALTARRFTEMPQPVNEKLRDLFLMHSIGLDRLTAGQVNKMGDLLVDAEKQIASMLRLRLHDISLGKIEVPSPVAYTTIPQRGTGYDTTRAMRRAVGEIGQILRLHSPRLYSQLEQDLTQLAAYEADFVKRTIETALPQGVSPFTQIYSPRPEVLHALVTDSAFQGHRLAAYFGDGPRGFAAGVQRRLKKTIQAGNVLGLPPEQIVRNLIRGGIKLPRQHLRAITRTATSHALNSAAEKVYETNATKQNSVLKGIQWVSTLDLRTTLEYCVPRDHAVYDIKTKKGINARGKRYPYGAGPGRIHWGCRSKASPVTKSFKELGIKAKELDRRSRASMDGEIAPRTTAEGWMRKQLKNPARRAELERLHGKERMRRWADGEITLEKMFNQSKTRMLRLDEMPGGAAASAAASRSIGRTTTRPSQPTLAPEAAPEPVTMIGGREIAMRELIYALGQEGLSGPEVYSLLESRGMTPNIKNVRLRLWQIKNGQNVVPPAGLQADELVELISEARAAKRRYWPPAKATKTPSKGASPTKPKKVDSRTPKQVVDDMKQAAEKQAQKADALEAKVTKLRRQDREWEFRKETLEHLVTDVTDEVDVLARLRSRTLQRESGYLDDLLARQKNVHRNHQWRVNDMKQSGHGKPGDVSFAARKANEARTELLKFERIIDDYERAVKAARSSRPGAIDELLDHLDDRLVKMRAKQKRLTAELGEHMATEGEARLLRQRMWDLEKAAREAREAIKRVVWDELPNAKPPRTSKRPIKLQYEASPYEASRREVAREAMEWMRRYFSGYEDFRPPVWAKQRGTRSKQWTDKIYLVPDATMRDAIHEYGHFIEVWSKKHLNAALKWRDAKTVGEKLQRLSKLNPRGSYYADEWAKPDKFIRPYVGKYYRRSFTNRTTNVTIYEHYATEVLSMGLEYFWADPMLLLQKDSDLFFYVVRACMGRL
jgi:hypothetical protein